MGSVRDRLERPLREAPEQIVDTGDRRTALAAGGSVSTRQAQQMRDDKASPEPTVTRQVTSAASCDFGNADGFSRTRDRHLIAAEVAEAAKPTPSQLAADAGLAAWKEQQAREAAAEAQAYATGKKVDWYQRQIAEAKAKVAAEAARLRAARESSGG